MRTSNSTAARSLDRRDVDLSHIHHRIERSLGGGAVGIGHCFGQSDRRNLPGQAPFVLAPPARTFFAAVADDCIPVTISLGLVSGCDLKRECFAVLERGATIEPEAGNSHHREIDCQYISLFPGRKVPWRELHRTNG